MKKNISKYISTYNIFIDKNNKIRKENYPDFTEKTVYHPYHL